MQLVKYVMSLLNTQSQTASSHLAERVMLRYMLHARGSAESWQTANYCRACIMDNKHLQTGVYMAVVPSLCCQGEDITATQTKSAWLAVDGLVFFFNSNYCSGLRLTTLNRNYSPNEVRRLQLRVTTQAAALRGRGARSENSWTQVAGAFTQPPWLTLMLQKKNQRKRKRKHM